MNTLKIWTRRTAILTVALGAIALLPSCGKSGSGNTGSGAGGAGTTSGGSTAPKDSGTTAATGAGATDKPRGIPDPAPKSYVVGVIAKAQNNDVFQAARKGAEDAARDLSKKYGANITVNWRTPNKEDAQQQSTFVEQLTSRGVSGIAISCSDANLATSAINDAVSKGVVVVTFDSDAPKSQRMCYYGVDDTKAGAKVMEELAKAMGDKGVVAILAGNQAAANLQARVKGVREEAARHPNISIKDVYYHEETPADAAAKMQQVQTANPDITGWALVGGWPLYTDNALDGIYQTAKVCSMDPLPLPLQYVKAGQVQTLVGQPYYGWGYESVKLIMAKVIEGKTPESAMVTAPFDIVTSANADEYEKKWQDWLPKK